MIAKNLEIVDNLLGSRQADYKRLGISQSELLRIGLLMAEERPSAQIARWVSQIPTNPDETIRRSFRLVSWETIYALVEQVSEEAGKTVSINEVVMAVLLWVDAALRGAEDYELTS